jgi:PKD repeat protein
MRSAVCGRRPSRWVRSPRSLWVIAVVIAAVGLPSPTAAWAQIGDIGFAGPSTQGTGGAATGEKPESKLWFNDGRWWASMFDRTSGTYHIWWLNRSTRSWVDTGVVIDDRPTSRADTLWDGTHLYVASAVYATSNTTAAPGNPTRLYRFSYNPVQKTYTRDAGFPVNINNTSSETITLDRDTSGRLWATWAQGRQVYYNTTTSPGNDSSWGTPAVLPVTNATGLDPDDISGVIAFGTPGGAGGSGGRIGVMWSNQTASTTYFAIHNDTDPVERWQAPEAVTLPGPKQSDDHLNVKELQTDDRGRVFAVIKTGLDEVAGAGSSAPSIVVLARARQGGWSRATFGRVQDCHTRPSLVLDASNNLVHVYATAPDSGCPFSGAPGTIFEKTSSIDNLSFPAGRGTPVMRSASSPNLNNVTGTKQTVNNATGIVLLASDDVARRYWTSDQALGPAPAPPTASFTATPTSGIVPLTVQFTDTSSGSPSAWAWNFGDGATSSEQNPQHVFANPGTYTVTLTATNTSGSSAPVTKTITVSPSSSAIRTVGSVSSVATTAVGAVNLSAPATSAPGDVLISSFTIDNTATVTPPNGWTPIVTGLKPNSGATLYAYYHVVTAGEGPTGYSWGLSAAQKWGGGITAYRGVNTTNPLDIPTAATARSGSNATSVTVPSVTTQTNGAELIGGFGADGSSATVAPPSNWTEGFESVGGQLAEDAHQSTQASGPSGPKTWSVSSPRFLAAWMSALRPG